MINRLFLFQATGLVSLLLLSALAQSWIARATLPPAPQTPPQKLASLISRDIFFGNPPQSQPKISPDGRYLAYIAPDQTSVLQIWLKTLGKNDDRPLTQAKQAGIRNYEWAYNGTHILFPQDDNGNEEYQLQRLNIRTQAIQALTPKSGVRAELIGLNPQFPNEALVAMNQRSPLQFDVYRINIKTGKTTLDTTNPGNGIDVTADKQFQVRAAHTVRPDGGKNLALRDAPNQPWRIIRQWEPNSEGRSLSFSNDGKQLYLLDNQTSDTLQLKALNLASSKAKTLASDAHNDITDVMLHPQTRQPIAVGIYRDRLHWQVLDPAYKADFAAIAKVQPGDVRWQNCDRRFTRCIIFYTSDRQPTTYYLYDRRTRKSAKLFSRQPPLAQHQLAPMQPITYQARDGLTIHGYLTAPVGVPAKNLPTVLWVHGGPWARDKWGYNAVVQWLANRGYAVLQVNFRGSTGYGKKFLNAGNREWAGKMHLDLLDGVEWLKRQGIAHPKKIAIAGGSYGGYASLVGMTYTPDVFAAGVDIVGPSNLITLLNSLPPYWFSEKPIFEYRLGNPLKDQVFLKQRSPVFFAHQIKNPLLIAHGANDPRVKQSESDQIVQTMRQQGKGVEYWVYSDEGHGFAKPANRRHFFAQMERLLAEHLGGRYELERQISGHSGQSR
ncbi:S9 family peptidase [filamentous cyanobacterium LEGE 11480]|uniref:S9 family peptidase n=1 Tax=Romeriopsis navalis LEGE 11480 TaxID=2777977 RepID=A0A928VJT1_9CYAN|nr:S9 family peptidase [Romeriopsis navalis]MBE9029923.1 S9 family peptidase [Romeriopsis navalis LEGE 11480]